MEKPYLLLKEAIISKVFVSSKKESIFSASLEKESWLFDFRRVMLTPEILDAYATLFLEKHKDMYPFQVGGLETAAIPLVSAIVLKSHTIGTPVNGFFIRKSRKKSGLLRVVEGEITKEKIILVDDLINSGSTFTKQIEILKQLKHNGDIEATVSKIFTILQFRADAHYSFLKEEGVELDTLFHLREFESYFPEVASLYSPEAVEKKSPKIQSTFDILWSWRARNPSLQNVFSKGSPVFYNNIIYIGADNGTLYAINSTNGEEVFNYHVPLTSKKGRMFSTLIVEHGLVIFGAGDGNVYAIDALTGKRKWVFLEGDYIGSEIIYMPHIRSVAFFSCSGFFKKRGEVLCIDAVTGVKKWSFIVEEATTTYLAYAETKRSIIVSTISGNLISLDANNGKERFRITTPYEPHCAPAIASQEGCIIGAGDLRGTGELQEALFAPVVAYDLSTGKELWRHKGMYFAPQAPPYLWRDIIIVTSPDKTIRALRVNNGEKIWERDLSSRVFSGAKVISYKNLGKEYLYVGTNGGHLFEIDPKNGEVLGTTIVSERIVDAITYDGHNEILFLATYANELYALRRKK